MVEKVTEQCPTSSEVMPRWASAGRRKPAARCAALASGALTAALLAGTSALAQVQNAVPPGQVERLLETVRPPAFVPGEVIVKLRDDTGAPQRLPAETLSPLGLGTAPARTSGGELIYRLAPGALFQLGSPQAVEARVLAAVEQLTAQDDVEYAQPNWIVRPVRVPGDPGFVQQWHYRDNGSGPDQSPGGINLPKAWDVTQGDPAVVVAVIDTGILPNHPDIAGSPNLIGGFDLISDPFIANDGDGRDPDPTDAGDAVAANECGPGDPPAAEPSSWHGTHVAGTVGVGNSDDAVGVAGINWHGRVQAVRVLGKCGGTIVDINDAIRWAAGLPVPGIGTNPTPARVINMSLGAVVPCSQSPATQAAIDDAVAAGVTVVVAAGNSHIDASGEMPASCNGVITVAASDARGHLVSRYSNFGPRIDIMAPGGDVRRDDTGDGDPDGVLSMVDGGFAFYNGTSMASPHVAGVAALLLAHEPTLTPADVLARIKAAAMPRDATQCPKPCGAGLLNAALLEPGRRDDRGLPYQYAAKLVCGLQRNPESTVVTGGLYGTTVNVRNPGDETVEFTKELALTIPPGGQEQGELLHLADDKLEAHHALETDCEDVRRRAGLPDPFFEGFVVIRSAASLDVTAVYTTSALDREGRPAGQAGIDVEPVAERVKRPDERRADLTVRDIDLASLRVSCPGGAGTCVTSVDVEIANIGAADAGAFNARTQLDPGQAVSVDRGFSGLAAGASTPVNVTTPPGGNCFDPDCTVCVTVDNLDNVPEADETNNRLCRTRQG